jgi:release factor glutamine methyltransferase
MPTVKQLLADARLRLADTETPGLDARLLLQNATGLSHAELIADDNQRIADAVAMAFRAMVARRAAFEPVSRILGAREFYGRHFKVTPDVLDPRADTETLVELCLTLNPKRILDLGTGSGILGVTILAEIESATGVAVDVSPDALAVARHNATTLGVAERLAFAESNWFSKVEGQFDLIVSNPPYIPAHEVFGLDVEVRDHDPHMALAGGADGLDCYRAIAAGAALHLSPDGAVVVEIGAGQAADVTSIFGAHHFHLLEQKHDLGGHVRALRFCFGIERLSAM